MGVILQGILGGFSGKVGPVVGGNWKGIDYMRGYVVPANPNTPAQQTQRTKFGKAVAYARQILATLLNVYWDPFAVEMSGFNRWIQLNIGELDVSNEITVDNIMSTGTLESIRALISATVNGDDIDIVWDFRHVGNGLDTDSIGVVFYDVSEDQLQFLSVAEDRSDGAASVTPDETPVASDLIFLFLYRGTGSEFIVSDSKSKAVVI